jgi:hypothetical protein
MQFSNQLVQLLLVMIVVLFISNWFQRFTCNLVGVQNIQAPKIRKLAIAFVNSLAFAVLFGLGVAVTGTPFPFLVFVFVWTISFYRELT